MRLGKLYVNDSTRDRNIDMVIVVDGLERCGDFPLQPTLTALRGPAAQYSHGIFGEPDRVGLIR